MTKFLPVINKLFDIFLKKSKNGEKEQDIEIKKAEIFQKIIAVIIFVTLFMCVIFSLFPELDFSDKKYWFDLLEEMINKI